MTADELLSGFGQIAGLGPLSLDADGVCRLLFDGTTAVDLERSPDRGTLHLHTSLGPVPPAAGADFYAMLLAANLFGCGTAGNMLAVLPVERTVFLCRSISLESAETAEFAELLAEFVRQARRWAHKVERGPDGAAVAAPPPAPVDFSQMVRV